MTAFVTLLRGVGVDPVKVSRALHTLLKAFADALRGRMGGGPPSPPAVPAATPVARSTLAPVALAAAAAFLLSGCSPSLTRAQARGALLTVAEGVLVADRVCADVAKTLPPDDGFALATKCARAYKTARASLLTADSALSSANAVADKQFLCAAGHAAQAVATLSGLLHAHGASLPSSFYDGVTMAQTLGSLAIGTCSEVPSAK